MNITVAIKEYSTETGMSVAWELGAKLTFETDGDYTIIRANQAGMLTMARYFLTIAQSSVPAGAHFNVMGVLDQPENGQFFVQDSHELIIEKVD